MPKHPKPVLMTQRDPAFYPTIGPFLASRAVHKALGGVPWDDATKTWIVLRTADGTVLGFCGVNQLARRTDLESLYTVPGHEEAAGQLVRTAVKEFGHDRDLHATVRHEIAHHHEAAGFHEVKTTANFSTLVRPATIRT
ncbi:hypothetical protein SMD44_p10168 (plasmid) [Streptomyces alboflavus]|uniref:N-acetyltransferase domain-containing protein n=1 Tax=Streptomyces alboflavus TaxID=67267 RepID=A0A291W428_9ACTN|nr:hypothetical protein [Streptomyces alboflavus]ATM24667.1 hypothetical protein SMD44_p10168 [Streptomyces alboflavus]